MKKLLVLLFSILISFNSYGEELKGFFGIDLYDNAEKYVSSNYIKSTKQKDTETHNGYFYINITDKITSKSPYFSEYWLTIDLNNNIHSIESNEEYADIKRCQEFLETLASSIEEIHGINFEYDEVFFPKGKRYRYTLFTSSNNYLSLQCNENDDLSYHGMMLYLDSQDLLDARNEFYNSGL